MYLTHVNSLLEFHESGATLKTIRKSNRTTYHEPHHDREMDSIPQEFHQRSKGNQGYFEDNTPR